MADDLGPYLAASVTQLVCAPIVFAVKVRLQSMHDIVEHGRQDEKCAIAFGFVRTSWQASQTNETMTSECKGQADLTA